MGSLNKNALTPPEEPCTQPPFGTRASLHTLGCKVNAYETEAMRELLEAAGYEIVPFGEAADVCVINTCSVTAMADSKSRQMLHRARAFCPDGIIVAAGCYVQTGEGVLAADPDVDILLGTNCRGQLVESIARWKRLRAGESGRRSRPPVVIRPPEDAPWEYEDLHIRRSGEHTRAFVKVQDGCNQFCTYCIIPYARGRIRSRDAGDVLAELQTLAAGGVREVVFSGIHISSYDGAGALPGQKSHPLVTLLAAAAEIPGIERLRLSSLEPRMITPETARELAEIPKLCPHFHLSLQSGCDAVLRRMNRHYTAAEFEQSVSLLRGAFDNPAITTDVIAGFPGETEEEFAATEAFVRRIGFYEMHVFAYSERPGTAAARLGDTVSPQEKKRRSRVLLELTRTQSAAWRKQWLGRQRPVLFEQAEEIGDARWWTGYTPEYIRVAVPDTGVNLRGQIRAGVLGFGTDEETCTLCTEQCV